jgi:2,3-bisphosphoglycerate-independent phosphoglycerate mutase
MRRNQAFVQNRSLTGAIRTAYIAGQEDEALEPIIRVNPSGNPIGRLNQGDYVIFYDIRGEREVELTHSLTAARFSHFSRKNDLRLNFVTMITYDPALEVRVAFPKEDKIKATLAEVIGRAGLRLAKISESEKAVHVGYFLNGKSDVIFPGEERFVIPSPSGLSSYVQKPEMSADLVAAEVSAKVEDPSYSLIIANLANVDVVGHNDNKSAALKAVEAVDRALGRIVEACRRQRMILIVTSDHGTVEEWLYPDGTVNTGHTRNPVPFLLGDFLPNKRAEWVLKERGELADVAPTVLDLLRLKKPVEMTGDSLILNSSPPEKTGRRVVLLILDGWGLRTETQGNLILAAKTPHFDRLWSDFPHSLLKASGEAVGLPSDTVGNSEAGHLHIGAGRRVLLDRVKIDKSIEDGSFFRNPVFLGVMEGARREKKALHLMGIVSHYSSHGTIEHLFALLRLAKESGLKKVYMHAFIGRRGEKPESGAIYVEKVEEMTKTLAVGKIVTVIGRHWALDREENWDRIEKAYRALVYGEGTKVCG